MWNIPSEKRLAKIPTYTGDAPILERKVHLHFFYGGSDWYVTSFNQDDTFFGFVILNNDLEMSEFGCFSFWELKEINMSGIEIDCELAKYFKPTKIKNIQRLKHLIPIYSK